MTAADREPFADAGAEMGADAAGFFGGQIARDAMLGDVKRGFRQRVLAFGARHGFTERESCLIRTVEGVEVSVPLYEISVGTAVVRARTLRVPLPLRVSTEPQGWVDRLKNKLRRDRVRTGDAAFDAAFCTTSTDVEKASRLFDARCIAALRAVSAWCRLTYDRGDVEARIDVELVAGAHLLEAEAAVVALALADVPTAPYR